MAESLQEKHVLVVDDEYVHRELMSYFLGNVVLSGAVLKISLAADAQEAITILATSKVDILFTDYRMPGMSGEDLCIFVGERYPDVLKVLVTGTMPEEKTAADLVRSKLMQKCLIRHVQQLLGEFAPMLPIEPCEFSHRFY